MLLKIKKIISFLAVVLVAVPLLAACGASQGPPNVTLDSYSIQMPATIKAGQVTFHVTNASTSDTHSFIIFKTDLVPGNLPLDSSNNIDETAQGLTRIDGIAKLEPGAVQDLTVTLQPGKYVAACDLPGHYQAGMFIGFTVK
jgi:uncharacterized cupredoxin-like copper-binding protein